MVSVGHNQSDELVTLFVAGDHHSEMLRRDAISLQAARAAMRRALLIAPN